MPPAASASPADASDAHRPLAHLTARAGWINDPLGLTFHRGRYHLFFQYVPDDVVWSYACHWGHSVGDDLVTWEQLPTALSPGDGDEGVWSGSIVDPPPADGAPGAQLYYTSVSADALHLGRVRVATPVDDSWERWRKGDVVAELPADIEVAEFRDPHILHDGTTWRMILGGGLTDDTAVAWTWTSPDRVTWTFAGELVRRSGAERTDWTGSVWECPVLIPVDGRWVLVMSVWEKGTPNYVGYGVGDLVDGRFVPQRWGRLSHGPSYYASSTFADAEGRPGLVHWVRDVADPAGRWRGAASVPQLLGLDGDRLVARPHPAFTSGDVVADLSSAPPVRVPAACWIAWDPEAANDALLTLSDEETATEVATIEATADTVIVTVQGEEHRVPTTGAPVGLLLDRLVLEVFTDAGILAVPLPPIGAPTLTRRGGGAGPVRLIREA